MCVYAQVIEQTIPTLGPNDPSEPIGCGETDGDRGIKDLCLSDGFEQSDQIPPDLDPSNPCWDSWKPKEPGATGKLPLPKDPTDG